MGYYGVFFIEIMGKNMETIRMVYGIYWAWGL